MSARRRRVGSESEHTPLTESSSIPDYDRHEGKLKNYKPSQEVPDQGRALVQNSFERELMMNSRERTKEFMTVVEKIRGRQTARALVSRDPVRKNTIIKGHGEFMMKAKVIGRNITSTYDNLEKLTLLAKENSSTFHDRTVEIQNLTYIIKEDINSLNQQLAMLQEIVRAQKRGIQNGKNSIASLTTNVVLSLQSKLASISTDFKQVLEVSTENLIQKKNKRGQFSGEAFPLAAMNGVRQDSLLEREDCRLDLEGASDTQPLLQSQRQIAIQDDTETYLEERASTMKNIESTIVELGGIFQQLATMVKEQEEMVDRIDSNVEATSLNVDAAHTEILKYFQSVMSNRWLMIKIFGVLIFFFMFFVIFMT